MTQKSSISDDETSVSRRYLREGDQRGYTLPVSDVSSGISSVTLAFYKQGSTTNTEASGATYWTTTACTVTGINTIVTGLTQNLKAGDWVLSINGTVDGIVGNIATIPITVKRRGDL